MMLKMARRGRRARREYMRKLFRAKCEFNLVRKEMKEILEFNDLEDEVATHFLKLNSDIQTLNSNQDLILDFIHNHFNANPERPLSEAPSS